MGLAYLKTLHGILSVLQVFLGLIALLAGYLLWDDTNDELYWLFYMGQKPLATVVLVILSLSWLYGLGILFQQLFVNDLLEKIGKPKMVTPNT
uniref:Dolichol-phosphate mannosyltransferase subunit 3 n=1 Tax=Meloidogyne javanica TaxID=6303 RepID=A0A915M144_MELJA